MGVCVCVGGCVWHIRTIKGTKESKESKDEWVVREDLQIYRFDKLHKCDGSSDIWPSPVLNHIWALLSF